MTAAVIADPLIFGARRSLEDAVGALKALPGIGEWTAQYIAMRELREPDAFPAADIGLMRALADETGRRPTPAELLARAEAWRPWRAYAALHLWSSEGAATQDKDLTDDRHAA
jgi:AraC family transcriptional regulator of adaptative response / DNA-3-methyladenine glycosylase II